MSFYPRISIVTPSYNQGAYLEESILSVLTQDYPDLEYIIIDGASTDRSVEIIKTYERDLSYWCSEPDEGQSDAIAKGFEKATGEILFWLGSDDLLLPGALKKVAEYFIRNPDIQVVSGGCVFIDSDGEVCTEEPVPFSLGVPASYNRFRFYEQDGVCQPATFWRRGIYEEVGGLDRSRTFIMDLDLFARMAKAGGSFGQLPKFLSCFRLHEESKSTTLQHVRRREFQDFACQHQRNAHGELVAQCLYWRYRLPSLLRKSALYAGRRLGMIRLPTVPYVRRC